VSGRSPDPARRIASRAGTYRLPCGSSASRGGDPAVSSVVVSPVAGASLWSTARLALSAPGRALLDPADPRQRHPGHLSQIPLGHSQLTAAGRGVAATAPGKWHAHAPVAGVRKGTPMTVLTVGDARCSWPASRCFKPFRTGPFPAATTCSRIIRILGSGLRVSLQKSESSHGFHWGGGAWPASAEPAIGPGRGPERRGRWQSATLSGRKQCTVTLPPPCSGQAARLPAPSTAQRPSHAHGRDKGLPAAKEPPITACDQQPDDFSHSGAQAAISHVVRGLPCGAGGRREEPRDRPQPSDPGGLFAGYAARLSSRRARWLVRVRSSGLPFQ